jgi:hypothetical protein
MELPQLDDSAFRDLSKHLKGVGGTYGLKKNELTRQTIVKPYIFHLLLKFARLHVPIPFTTIKVNGRPPKSAKEYYIVGFGSYIGGELKFGNNKYDIWHKPQIINGPCEHTPVISGKRMTLTFYSLESTRSLAEYEPVIVDDEWAIKHIRQFEPPIYLVANKRMKTIVEDDEVDDIPSDAVEFLRGIIASRSAQPQAEG